MIRKFEDKDIQQMITVWNEVVEAGNAFPQIEGLTKENAYNFFESQSYTGVYEENGEILGLYILHPNNIGRCGHLCNASYAVRNDSRGRGIGKELVKHCIKKAAELSFRVLQFNAVVKSNKGAVALYEQLGFTRLGTVPGGFLNGNGEYEDIVLFYIEVR